MFARHLLKLSLALALIYTQLARADDLSVISPNGKRLAEILNQTRVEALWLPGIHVNWESGEADGMPLKGDGKHTHCSSFAAALAKQLGVYILRPPDHSAKLLANAQYDWLNTQGREFGWQEQIDAMQAQAAANRGLLVVAVYRNHHDDKPGHIAILRPELKTLQQLELEGPQITQAGATNYLSTSLAKGFASHPAAWKKKEVRYFSHEIDWHGF